ncbi:hypothetical protein BOTBODRAFT_133776 [Botryobasidium botryosum FD-172 SS1]|uniref:3-hydroxyisobutyrate dehydrogenase n=1 Tax=Botryobasidium botryosum (strain FD-172 SS1) TaxID=930990 RepID=A0A067MBR1_BOTB1|nr:hypothetical protein BOTBODRAFT_133776 [Botryobasidium botryosum FD-172 SS1]
MRPTARVLSSLGAAAAATRPHTLGFIGLGQMGQHMASNLYAKHLARQQQAQTQSAQRPPVELVVCDANEAAAGAFAAAFARDFPHAPPVHVVTSPAQVAARASTLITMLPSSPQVKDVYLGPGGIISALQPESSVSTLCIDSTTLDVDVAKDVAQRVDAAGGSMLDAPVSGGVVGAQAGTLSFMVGGPAPAFERARPHLENMGKNITHCGPNGTGLVAKIANNLILGINQIAVAEAMLLGTSLGLAPALLAKIINNSTGKCWPSEVNNPVPGALEPEGRSPPCERGYEGGFASRLMLKDMLLALHAAKTVDVPLPIGTTCAGLYEDVSKHREGELASKDFSVVYEYLRRAREGGGNA